MWLTLWLPLWLALLLTLLLTLLLPPCQVHAALLSEDPQDQLSIAYHLLIDNKRLCVEAERCEVRDFYGPNSPPPTAPLKVGPLGT